MKEPLTCARQREFCRAYLRTLDPQRAAAAIGEEDGFEVLQNRTVRTRLERMRAAAGAQILREDAVRRLAELAFGRANDACLLALTPEEGRPNLTSLDLSAVSELKVTDKGVEIKFLDRIRALEALATLLNGSGEGAEDFFRALEDSAEATT